MVSSYDLNEPLPDHSSLTKIRRRYGIEAFRRFFDKIVEQYQEAGLVWGKELYIDSTKVEANASVDSVKPRFFVEAHLANLFSPEAEEGDAEVVREVSKEEPLLSEHEELPTPKPLPTSLSPEEYDTLTQHNEARHDWIEHLGEQDRSVTSRGYHRMADLRVSTTDPDATLMPTKDGTDMGYRTHYVVDGGKARIIVAALVTPKARHGQSTDARPALARPLPLETLASTGDRRPQIWHRRQSRCHRTGADLCLHTLARFRPQNRFLEPRPLPL